jgi:putative transposase
MIGLEDRKCIARWIDSAHLDGARLRQAFSVAEIDVRMLQHWKPRDGLQTGGRRTEATHPTPSHALTEQERAAVLTMTNEPRLADMPPARIVPTLADEGVYLASESTFSRVLRAAGRNRGRGCAQAPHAKRSPQTHVARAARQMWRCWPARTASHGSWLEYTCATYTRSSS